MNIEETKKLRLQFGSQVSEAECIELYDKVLNTPAGAVVEVGSATGGSIIFLIAAAQEVGKMVYSIDPYPEDLEDKAYGYGHGMMKSWKNAFKKNILNGKYDNIVQYNEDVADCIDKIPDGLSFVFIDGCHEYEFVKNDFELLVPKLISGGWIYLHDAGWEAGSISRDPEKGVNKIAKRICPPKFQDCKPCGVMYGGRKT